MDTIITNIKKLSSKETFVFITKKTEKMKKKKKQQEKYYS